MPVFNTAANITPWNIVGNYYQGKAVRLGQANAELANERLEKQNVLLDQEIAAAPSKNQQAQEAYDIKMAQAQETLKKSKLENGEEILVIIYWIRKRLVI